LLRIGSALLLDLPTTQAACERARAEVQTHEYKLMGFNCSDSGSFCFPVYGWQQVSGEVAMHGTWLVNGWGCILQPSSPLPQFQPSLFRRKVRVAIRAYAWNVLTPVSYKRGKAGIQSWPVLTQ